MVSELLSSWLLKLDRKFQYEKHKVAIIVDNCPTYQNIQSKLKAINLAFLPPNTTSKSQPCDEGIIQYLKVHYRKHLLLQLITAIEARIGFELISLMLFMYHGTVLQSVLCLVVSSAVVLYLQKVRIKILL